MTDIRIVSNSDLFQQTLDLNATSAGTPASISIANYGDPPEIIIGDFFPTLLSVGIGQMVDAGVYDRRHVTVDLAPLGTPDSVTVRNLRKQSDGTPVGKIKRRGTAKAHIQLQEYRGTDPLLFDYTATKAGNDPVEGVGVVTVIANPIPRGWGLGRYYVLAQDSNKRMIVTPGRNHRKVHCTPAGLSVAAIAARHSVSEATVTATWLRDTVALGAGSDGSSKYGELPALALDATQAIKLWNQIAKNDASTAQTAASHWLLFERGQTYPAELRADSPGAPGLKFGFGESRLHPIYVGPYGSGARPIMNGHILPSAQSRCIVIQDLHTTADAVENDTRSADYLIFSCNRSFRKFYVQGNAYTVECATLSGNAVIDGFPLVAKPNSKFPGYWQQSGERASGTWASDINGLLIMDSLYEHNGWADGYRVDTSNAFPYPPEVYSHNLYLSSDVIDTTVKRNSLYRGGFTACQIRAGGLFFDNIASDCNGGYFSGDGKTLLNGEPVGTLGSYYNNITVGAAFRDALWQDDYSAWAGTGGTPPLPGPNAGLRNNQTYKARAINFKVPLTAGIGNMAINSGVGTQIASIYEIGPTGIGSGQMTIALNYDADGGASAENCPNDTIVYNWADNANLNADSLPGTAVDATMAKYADFWLATTGSTKIDFFNAVRALDDPFTQIKPTRDFLLDKMGRPVTVRGVATTVTFAPREDGYTPGFRGDVYLDWSTGDLPGTVAGDSIDLDGYSVTFHENPANTLAALDLGSGVATYYGGKWAFTSLVNEVGAGINISLGAEFWVDGFTGANLVTVNMDAGRFANTGTMTGQMNLTAVGEAEVLFSYDSGAYTIASGRTVKLDGGYLKAGWDGSTGAAASLTVAAGGTLEMRSATILSLSGITTDPASGGKRVLPVVGSRVTGQTSGATAIVAELVKTNVSTCQIILSDVNGIFQNGEAIHGDSRESFQNILGLGFVGNVAAVPVYTMPQIAEFRSGINGTTAPNVVTTFTCGGTLRLDVTGMANAAYDLVVADTVSGTFATVDVQGGTGTVSYTATKVIFTKTA